MVLLNLATSHKRWHLIKDGSEINFVWEKYDIGKIFSPQKTTHTSPSCVSYGVPIVSILEPTDHVGPGLSQSGKLYNQCTFCAWLFHSPLAQP